MAYDHFATGHFATGHFATGHFATLIAPVIGGINKIIAALRLWKQLHEGED